MQSTDIYELSLDVFTPDTLPMARLADYMAAMARILGETEHVHFTELNEGSAVLASRVDTVAVPKVRDNVAAAQAGAGHHGQAMDDLNALLRSDNASANMRRNGDNVIEFPGIRQQLPPRLGPFDQDGTIDGVLVSIGGRDKTAHGTLMDSENNRWKFTVTRDLARQLAPHLYGKPLRLEGTERLFRESNGRWTHEAMKATRFVPLDDTPLHDWVMRLRDQLGAVNTQIDLQALIDERHLGEDEGDA